MADYLIHDYTLEDIADAIRAKSGYSSMLTPGNMANVIHADLLKPSGTISITDGAIHDVREFAYAFVDVTPPALTTKEITQNGTYYASDDNADGFSEVQVNVSAGTKYQVTVTGELNGHETGGGSVYIKFNDPPQHEYDYDVTCTNTNYYTLQVTELADVVYLWGLGPSSNKASFTLNGTKHTNLLLCTNYTKALPIHIAEQSALVLGCIDGFMP